MAKIELEISDELRTPEVADFAIIAEDCINLYAKKNHDYGNSFDKGMNDIGNAYGVGRIYDKVNRLVTLNNLNPFDKPQITNENIEDTLMDLACYSIMMLAYRKRERAESMKEIELN